MKIIDIDATNIQLEEVKNLNLCLGFFDGVHLGHQEVINKALNSGLTGVMTFDVPPHFATGQNLVNVCLTSLYDKCNILEEMGVKYLYVLRTSKELLDITRDDFVESILKKINPCKIFVGDDYRFGKEAKGTPNYLSTFFNVDVTPLLLMNNKKVSSRRIVELVDDGNVEKANELLSRPYQITGLVIHGKGNGESIGFPTANLELDFPYVLPKVGVYYGLVSYLDKEYKALICVSTHPSIMELNSPIIEVHLLYYSGDLYGKEIDIKFLGFIRDIKKFENVEDLKNQIKEDVNIAKNAFK